MQPSLKTGFSYLNVLCCIGVSIACWAIFFPGILTPDSVQQYKQAVTGAYTDWHPPIMAFLISCVLRAGGDLGLITLAQFFFGFYGVSRLGGAVSKLLGASKSATEWASLISVPVFILPVMPFLVFLATLGKDTWTLISMVWVLVLLMEIYELKARAVSFEIVLKAVLLAMVIGLLILLRHNTILIHPVIIICILYVFGNKRSLCATAVVIPLLTYLAFGFFQYRMLDATRIHIERVVYEIDLVSMIAYEPGLRSALPYTGTRLQDDLDGNFVIGDRAYVYIYVNELIDQADYLDPQNGELLAAEYRSAVTNFPGTWLAVKTIMFLDMFEPFQERPVFQDYMQKNEYGISFDSRFSRERDFIFEILGTTSRNPVARWFSFVHLPWLLINISIVLSGMYAHRKAEFDGRYMALALIFCIPLAYYFSYFPAVTASDFRFMYPSTLVIQAAVLGLLFNLRGRRLVLDLHKGQSNT